MPISSTIENATDFFESVDFGVLILDEDLAPVWSNQYYRKHIERDIQLCDKHCFSGLAPDEERCEDCLPPQAQRLGRTLDTYRSVQQEGGRERRFRLVFVPVGGRGHEVVAFLLPQDAQDLTPGQPWRERFLLSAIRNSDDAIFALDRQNTVRFWNRGAAQLFGMTIEEIGGRTLDGFFLDENRPQAEAIFHPEEAEEALPKEELEILGRDGRRFWVEVSRTPLRDGSGVVNGASFVLRDVTERKEAFEKMVFTERMSAVGNMAAALAHEIGTPLGVISSNAEMLLLDCVDDGHREDLEVILRETERIHGLVRQLLDFSRPEAPDMDDVDLAQVVGRVQGLVHHTAHKQGTELVVETQEDLPAVRGDRDQLEQLVLNLVMNALQSLGRGGRVAVRVSAGERGGVALEVEDDGPGIDPTVLPQIFHPFFTTKPNGTGLGLAVCKRIVEQHVGSISASHGEERGAAFHVWLPGPGD